MSSTTAAAEPSGVGRASAVLASGTLVSRILGLISIAVLAQTLGSQGSGANAFILANRLPNSLYALVAGGVLSAILVPQIVRASLQKDGGQRYINRLLTLGFFIFIAVAAAATVAAPLLVRLYAESDDGAGRGLSEGGIALATAFAYWCLPQILFYALYSMLGQVLNARKIFGPFTWAPAVNNLVVLAGLLVFNLLFAGRNFGDPAAWTTEMIAVLAGSATLGIAIQALVLTFFWRKAGLRYRPEFTWRGVGLGRLGTSATWMFGMVVVTQIAGVVQTRVASLAAGGSASIAVLDYSWLIFMLPHSLVTMSIITAYYTRMSGHARDNDLAALKKDLSAAVRSIGLIMVFAAAGLMVLAYPIAAVFTKGFEETAAMAHVLIAFLFGLIPFTLLVVMQRIFFALEDTRSPFWQQVFHATLFIAAAYLIVDELPAELIAVGLAVLSSVTLTLQAALAAVMLRKRLDGMDAARVIRQYLVFLLAMVPAAPVGLLIVYLLGGFTGGFAVSGIVPAILTTAGAGTAMLAVYILALLPFRTPELRDFMAPLLMRARRSPRR